MSCLIDPTHITVIMFFVLLTIYPSAGVTQHKFHCFAAIPQRSDDKSQQASQSRTESEESSWAQAEQSKAGNTSAQVETGGGECCVILQPMKCIYGRGQLQSLTAQIRLVTSV